MQKLDLSKIKRFAMILKIYQNYQGSNTEDKYLKSLNSAFLLILMKLLVLFLYSRITRVIKTLQGTLQK